MGLNAAGPLPPVVMTATSSHKGLSSTGPAPFVVKQAATSDVIMIVVGAVLFGVGLGLIAVLQKL